jgi:hypothetical protein
MRACRGVKIVLTMERAVLVVAVITQDENDEEEKEDEKDEMLINGSHRLTLCLSLLFPLFLIFNHN